MKTLSPEARKRIEASCRKKGIETPWEYEARKSGEPVEPIRSLPNTVRPCDRARSPSLTDTLLGALGDALGGDKRWS